MPASIASLGDGADAVKAAQDFVHAEQNFNPFNQDVPTLCSDPTLPTTAVLRGILPLIDPAVGGSDVANQLANQSLTTPFASTGMSIAQIFAANGCVRPWSMNDVRYAHTLKIQQLHHRRFSRQQGECSCWICPRWKRHFYCSRP